MSVFEIDAAGYGVQAFVVLLLAPKGRVPLANNRKCSVLIVEDDPTTRSALVKLLSHLGYVTIPVATIQESLERLDGQDFAILDLNLPDGLGTTVLERIRAENRPIRVAISSATTDLELLREAERLSPEIMLRKPINVTALLQWLEQDARHS